jgi:Protease inhibitor Inh
MSTHTRLLGVAAAVLLASAGMAAAQEAAGTGDHEAGVSLSPSEAAGAWTLESGGHSICVLKLGAEKIAGGAFKAEASSNCGDTLPAGVAGWTPSAHGMNLVDAGGQTLIGFGRWSNSLLVSHRSSGVDVQLRRGT